MIRKNVEDFFGENSPLRNGKLHGKEFKYELRPQQVEMALAVADALDGQCNLCVEAPTGVGKTFAYLIPALFHAREMHKAVIISTHTINLQEQIIKRDIPFLEALLNTEIRAVVAKGRSHYLCMRRLNNLFSMDQGMLAFDGSAGEISRLQRWADRTPTGDSADLPRGISPQLWSSVCCERGNCAGAQCEYRKACFHQRAKRKLRDAEIVISNHAKFFTELAMQEDASKQEGMESSFPEYHGVILDEGHTLEDAATGHLGFCAESGTIRMIFNRLYHPERKTGLLAEDAYGSLRDVLLACRQQMNDFLQGIIEWMIPQQKNPLRYITPGYIKNEPANILQTLLQRLQETIQTEGDASRKAELSGLKDSLEEQAKALEVFFPMSEENCVYWMELSDRKMQDISFHVVPIDVAALLQEKLFAKAPIVVTSATLAVNGNIAYFQNRLGCQNARSLILGTPFDYANQVALYIARNMPPPQNRLEFIEHASYYIQYFLQYTQGHAFVLFTSYSMMHDMAQKLKGFLEESEMTLLMQGEGLSPARMLEQFRESDNAVIFGTASFWTGVDVPGDALQNVIITRLPFSVPDNPVVEARSQALEQSGRNSFMEYSVPEAILKFRQGFGRLIRTKDDTGIVVILDSRVVTKYYGANFLRSIPACPIQYFG